MVVEVRGDRFKYIFALVVFFKNLQNSISSSYEVDPVSHCRNEYFRNASVLTIFVFEQRLQKILSSCLVGQDVLLTNGAVSDLV